MLHSQNPRYITLRIGQLIFSSVHQNAQKGISTPSLDTNDHHAADEAKRISAELLAMSKMQYEALQKASYLRMPHWEREVYDRRRARIGDLCAQLAKYRPKDADAAD
jgi:hypothetical protein